MSVWRFEIDGDTVHIGGYQRQRLMKNGCNEPFKGRYWCPKKQWFSKESCPFSGRRECENFEAMCGCL